MLSIVLALGFVVLVNGQATRCCVASQWSAVMTDVREVAKGNKVSSNFYYDIDSKSTAIQFFRFGEVVEQLTRVVTHYSTEIRYNIQPDGTCTSNTIKDEAMLMNCVPDSASYLGSNYIGNPTTGLKYDSWQFPLGNLNLTMSFSNQGCVPIIEGVVGTVAAASIDKVYFFNGYKSGITDPSAFNVPPGC